MTTRPRSSTSRRPRLDPIRLVDLRDSDPATLVSGADFDGERFTDADTEGRNLSGATFTECELLGWNAHETTMQGARFLQTRIERMNAPIAIIRRTAWRDIEMHASRLGAVEWYESTINQALITASKLGWVNLRSTELRDVVFRSCRIEELDLSGATVSRVAFEETSVDRLVLNGTRATHLDLRGLDFHVIEGLDNLRGAILTNFQATQMAGLFATHLGITIED
ncbi:pentapeptide repeat-containing protein [Microbacterium sp. NPDC089698]|uniref:pentapeptide repeat-containing protein n=1 Tax=Microbacterium sp. NPDC089698 TaxID=3364200 RepID=UPI0037F835FF